MSNVHSDDIFSLISSLQKSHDTDKLIVEILSFASDIAQADGCFLYKITPSKYINLEYINIKSLRLSVKGASCDKFFAPEYLPQSKNKKNKHPSEICAVTKDILNTPNLYNEPSIDASALKIFDLENSYNSVSLLAFPLFDSNENVISVVQFINAKNSDGKTVTFSTKIQDQVVSLCQLISVLLERQQQAIIYNKFLESIVSTFTKIILSKAPHISSIKNSVPVIAQMIAVAASTTSDENFKDFEMSDNQWNLLNIASWIYDCGRIMAPDYVLNKSTKLETVSNRIHEIRNRFEILRRDAHIEYLQKRLNNVADKEILQAEFVSKVKKLHNDFNFVGLCIPQNLRLLERIALSTNLDVEWGGGIKSEEALHRVFDSGAKYAIVGSVAARKPELFAQWLVKFGGERMVLGADVRQGKVSVNGWQEDLSLSIEELVEGLLPSGLSQVICTDIERDGMLQGPSVELYEALQGRFEGVDFTVSGGISSMHDIETLSQKGLRRVIVGKAIYENRITLKDIERWLLNA